MTAPKMKKRLLFSFCGLGIALLGMTLLMRSASLLLLRSETQLASDLARSGWTLTVAQHTRHYTPLAATLSLVRPTLAHDARPVWLGTSLILTRSIFHPFSLLLSFEGPQILRPDILAQDNTIPDGRLPDSEAPDNAAPDTLRTIRFADAHTVYWPGTNRGKVSVSQIVMDDPEGRAFRSARLHTVTATFLFNPEARAGETRWALDLRARRAEIQAGPAIPALAASIPIPENIELRMAALQGKTRHWDRATGYERFLIQSMSFEMKGLICSIKGTIDPDGTGDLAAHIVGLKNFARNWLVTLPASLRERPDYAPFLQKLNDEMARIPDRVDLPVPLTHNDISLQNHVFAIISGHSL